MNERTEYTPGGDVLACCWLSSQHSEEEFGDTLLAVAGRDNSVSVISVVTSAVVALLKGHTKVIQARGALALCVSFVWLRDACAPASDDCWECRAQPGAPPAAWVRVRVGV